MPIPVDDLRVIKELIRVGRSYEFDGPTGQIHRSDHDRTVVFCSPRRAKKPCVRLTWHRFHGVISGFLAVRRTGMTSLSTFTGMYHNPRGKSLIQPAREHDAATRESPGGMSRS
jgi:hypothetical protein